MKSHFLSTKHLSHWTSARLMLLGVWLVLLLSSAACGSQSAPASQPTPATDPGEVQALVEAAVEAAVSKSAARSGEAISQQELREMMAEVLAEAPPVPSQGDLADLVAKSIKKELAARPAPISKDDVERIIQTEMAGLQEAVEVSPKPPAEVGKPTIVFSDLTWDSVRLQNRIAMFIVEHGYGYPELEADGDWASGSVAVEPQAASISAKRPMKPENRNFRMMIASPEQRVLF